MKCDTVCDTQRKKRFNGIFKQMPPENWLQSRSSHSAASLRRCYCAFVLFTGVNEDFGSGVRDKSKDYHRLLDELPEAHGETPQIDLKRNKIFLKRLDEIGWLDSLSGDSMNAYHRKIWDTDSRSLDTLTVHQLLSICRVQRHPIPTRLHGLDLMSYRRLILDLKKYV
ncbi:GL25401 [Drosophila persimilis]|uniref:GL25401 n=1 Tax=Drosophila persimilis TaxID=7234 RepID=B4HCX4_DROPE|nr:GL25401 [Drosophila persimilis]